MSQSPDTFDTSFHAKAAADGDLDSVSWIVDRFTPLLLAQADRRMGTSLRRHYDPEDVVNDVWGIALPRLGSLDAAGRRHAPVLVKFLGTTLLRRIRDLARKRLGAAKAEPEQHDEPAADVTGVITGLEKSEDRDLVWQALTELAPADRDVVVFRGIEQRSHKEIAALLEIDRGTVAVRYHRALRKLREKMPRSVFEDLPDEAESSP